METVAELVLSTSNRPDSEALRGPEKESYTYERLSENAQKVGNLLSHMGAEKKSEAKIGIYADPSSKAILSFLGASLLGAETVFKYENFEGFNVVLAPAEKIGGVGEGQYISYGSRHENPRVSYFEREVWSENPWFPKDDLAKPEDVVLSTQGEKYTNSELVSTAAEVAEKIDEGNDVVIRSDLSDPGVVVGGVLAPLIADASIVIPDEDTVGDVGIGRVQSPETRNMIPRI